MAVNIANLTASLNAAVTQVNSDVAALPAVTTATVSQLARLAADIATAQALAQQVLTYWDQQMTALGAAANFAAATAPATMVANVSVLQNAAAAVCYAFDCLNKLGRLGKNVAAVQN